MDFRSTLQFYLIDCTTLPGKLIDNLIVLMNMAVCAILVVETYPVNAGVSTFTDAFYFTVVALTTVGFGDITPLSEGGKWVTILMILSGIVLTPWQISRIVKEWIHIARKRDIVCPSVVSDTMMMTHLTANPAFM